MKFFIAWFAISAVMYVVTYLHELAFEELRYLIKGKNK